MIYTVISILNFKNYSNQILIKTNFVLLGVSFARGFPDAYAKISNLYDWIVENEK